MGTHLVTDIERAHLIALREDVARIMLDCGHVATPDFFLVPNPERYADTPGQGVTGATGYAILPDGKRVCYADADAVARADMLVAGEGSQPFVAYVSGDDQAISTWSGGVLANVTRSGMSRSGFNGSEIHTYRATTPDGHEWYGRNSGPGMVITMRPAKRNG